jgi:heavy metal translocating P-type ATPase
VHAEPAVSVSGPRSRPWWLRGEHGLLILSLAGLAMGGALHLLDLPGTGDLCWAAVTAVGLVAAIWWVFEAARQRRLGVDLIAVLALGGSLLVGEYLAGSVITVMLATGRVLEARAADRAGRDLRALLERAPRTVHRYEDGELVSRPPDEVRRGDLLLVRPGEVVPVDGTVERAPAVLDESALTGEPVPVEREAGDAVGSGVVNAGGPFDLRATTTAADSTYAGIMRLVSQAQAATAPFVRLADRYAVAFLVLTVGLAGVAWLASGDPVRAVAVLVVATPCPLILAAPVAIVSGLAQTARRSVIVKDGGALERLAEGETLLLDKTGTLTEGRPAVTEVVSSGALSSDDVLRLAASVDQVSPHVLAGAVVSAARRSGLALVLPSAAEEVPGKGITGRVDGHEVSVGKAPWIVDGEPPEWVSTVRRRAELDGSITVFVGVDGEPAGAIVLDDRVRRDARRTIRQLRHEGISRVVMLTGDRGDVAQAVGAVMGVDEVIAECSPTAKVEAVEENGRSRHTIMVGDGINDAPALAAADVGVAIAARGSTASSEAADVVLVGNQLDRLGDAIRIARRSRRIAWESVVVGIGLSLVAMVVAALGYLPPVYGALLQEGIDVAVIANALRVVRPPRAAVRVSPAETELMQRFSAEHDTLRPELDLLRSAAEHIGTSPPQESVAAILEAHRFLSTELLPHEKAEDTTLYPVFDRIMGGTDATGTMSRAHVEIEHLIDQLGRVVGRLQDEPSRSDLFEARRLLYGLHAILELHFDQEDESYLSLVEAPSEDAPAR